MTSEPRAIDRTALGACAPCFPTRDVSVALAHYRQLGFEVLPYEQGMQWAWVRCDAAEIHLFFKSDHDPARTAAAADVRVADVDALHRDWTATGCQGTSEPYDTAYGREVVHVDPDNNLLRAVAPLRRD